MLRLFRPVLTFHWLTTLALMGLFALGFGLVSLNLIAMLSANFSLIFSHGVMALLDGALQQLVELVFFGYLAIVCYVLFKSCERSLVTEILG